MINLKVMYIICIILTACYVLSELSRLIKQGKFIIRIQKNIIFIETMLGIGTIIFSGISIAMCTISYLNNEEINNMILLQQMPLLSIGVFNFLPSRRYSGIKKNGISIQYGKETYFYKWNEIKGYKWIDEDEFQFEVLQKNNTTIYRNMEIGNYEQDKIDEVLQRHILKN